MVANNGFRSGEASGSLSTWCDLFPIKSSLSEAMAIIFATLAEASLILLYILSYK